MKSIFSDKNVMPVEADLKKALAGTYDYWNYLVMLTDSLFPANTKEWFVSSAKYGWAFRIKDKKRALIYLLPRDGFFKVAFVFGQKATNEIFESDVSEMIKNELRAARVYMEGRGLTLEIKGDSLLKDIKKLIEAKIRN